MFKRASHVGHLTFFTLINVTGNELVLMLMLVRYTKVKNCSALTGRFDRIGFCAFGNGCLFPFGFLLVFQVFLFHIFDSRHNSHLTDVLLSRSTFQIICSFRVLTKFGRTGSLWAQKNGREKCCFFQMIFHIYFLRVFVICNYLFAKYIFHQKNILKLFIVCLCGMSMCGCVYFLFSSGIHLHM